MIDEGLLRSAFSGRYELQRELGRGRTATVYLVRDLRHDRLVAVKVLHPEVAEALGAERFAREIRIAAQLQHPHILPLHDSGQVNGLLYYVMPYVEGESLRDRLERERQLPIAHAVRIASEVADGLAYAHSLGIVHRDIKPGNILLSGGHAVVADFGIAKAVHVAEEEPLTQTGLSPGTPIYMSPEQAGGDVVDGRSDVYSLGCVLYEMLTGAPPITGATHHALVARKRAEDPPPPSIVRPTVPPRLEQEVMRCLARVAADRHESAEELAAALRAVHAPAEPPVVASPQQAAPSVPITRRRSLRRAVLLAPMLGIAAVATILLTSSAPLLGFEERDWLLLADVQSAEEHEDLARTLGNALAIGLEQTSHANLFARNRVAGVLALMERPADTPIDETVGREVARRAGIKGVLVPALDAVGVQFLITLRLIDPATGDAVESYSRQAADRNDLLDEADALLKRVRRDLGESLFAIRRTPPLPAITTRSLEALELFVAGRDAWRDGRYPEAIEHFEHAVRVDSNFAFAYAALGNAYTSWVTRQPEKGRLNFEKALDRIDRVGPRERYFIQAQYHNYFGRQEDAIRYYRLHLEQYPDDRAARYNLANSYRAADECGLAIAEYRHVVRLDSTDAGAFVNIATCLAFPMRQLDSAITYYRRAFAIQPRWEVSGNLNHEFGMVLARAGRRDEARAVFERRAAVPDRSERANGIRSLAQLALLEGRIGRAREHLEQASALHSAAGEFGSAARDLHWLALAEIVRGDLASARELLERASRDAGWAPGWLWLQSRIGRALLAAGDTAGARRIADRIRATDLSVEVASERMDPELLFASLHSASGRSDSASAILRRHERAARINSEVLEVLINAAFAAGRPEDAAEHLQRLIELESISYDGLLAWVIAHPRYAALAESLGDSAAADSAYAKFVALWDDADPELQPLVAQARKALGGDAPK